MIDLHTHLLPGVDDGSPSVDVSVPVLERFRDEGVETVVLTPHINASRVLQAPHDRHAQILDTLRVSAPPVPALHLGWEIMLDVPGADLAEPRLSLGGSGSVLVEFPRTSLPPNAAVEIFRLRMSGLVPVLAHPERYWGCTPELVEEWRRVGAVIQMDAAGVLGSPDAAELSMLLLEQGLVDLLASDTHGDARSLGPARQWLEDVATPEHASLLTHENARRLLAGEPVLPVPPLPRRRGVVSRLRDLIFG